MWWTYRFYAQTGGVRLTCLEGPSGSDRLVALGFADPAAGRIRAMVGVRDGVRTAVPATIVIRHLSRLPGLATAGAVRVSLWDNPQTSEATTLDQPTAEERLPIVDDAITLTQTLPRWGAVLLDLAPAIPERSAYSSATKTTRMASAAAPMPVASSFTLSLFP